MQSWDRRTSQAFIWGRSVFVSPLASMRLNKKGVQSASRARTHTAMNTCMHSPERAHKHMHTYTPTNGLRAASLFWLWVWVPSWYLRLVDWQSSRRQQTHTHTQFQGRTVPSCNVCQLQACPLLQREAEEKGQDRLCLCVHVCECACTREKSDVRVDKDMKKNTKSRGASFREITVFERIRLKVSERKKD